jgi:NDP-sugar pyrophosphorylase family protein
VRLDHEQRVTGFAPRGSADGTYHFIGVQMVQAGVFSKLPAGQPAQSIGGVYDALIAARPGSVRGFVTDSSFWDVGTVADYWTTSWAFMDDDVLPAAAIGRNAQVDPGARISRSILWDDVRVDRGCVIDECVVTDRVSVPAGARFRRAILLRADDGTLRTWPLP